MVMLAFEFNAIDNFMCDSLKQKKRQGKKLDTPTSLFWA